MDQGDPRTAGRRPGDRPKAPPRRLLRLPPDAQLLLGPRRTPQRARNKHQPGTAATAAALAFLLALGGHPCEDFTERLLAVLAGVGHDGGHHPGFGRLAELPGVQPVLDERPEDRPGDQPGPLYLGAGPPRTAPGAAHPVADSAQPPEPAGVVAAVASDEPQFFPGAAVVFER